MDEPVGPLSAAIAYLLSQGDLVDLVAGRIAGRHRFALADGADGERRGWPASGRALTLRLAGADGVDTAACADAAITRVRVEARAWGASPAEAERVWFTLERALRRHRRGPVALPDGRRALLYTLASAGDGPQGEADPDTGIDILRGTLRVWVAAEALTT